MRKDCGCINFNRSITFYKSSNIFCILRSMTLKCFLITCRSNGRNMTEINIIPIISTHLAFHNFCQFNKTLTIELWSPVEVLTKLDCNITLTRHPLCTKTMTSIQSILNQIKCSITNHTRFKH